MKDSITHGALGVRRTRRPAGRSRASGNFVLRLDPLLHGLLKDEALAAGLSLNDWCGRTLAAPGAGGLLEAAPGVVLTIRSRLGSELVGVILYGSFARGTPSSGSDVDLLVVIEAGVPITRSLYREWEGAVPAWNGREMDLHFVHLSAPNDPVSGSWAEAAVCGIVLYDRELAISQRLIAIREHIAAGGLVRRMSQGQPYWIHEAPNAES